MGGKTFTALIVGWVLGLAWVMSAAVAPAAQRVHATMQQGIECATDTECQAQHGGDGGPGQ